MTTTPVSSVPGTTSTTNAKSTPTTQSTINGAQKSLVNDQQTFLTLLTAQLKNQDPLSPLDPSQFTQQLVQMTGVQQQIMTNQLLQQMVDKQTGVGDPVGLIGKTVTATTDGSTLAGGKADWLYSLPGAATDVKVVVKDDQGKVVYSSDQKAQSAGEHAFRWDGKTLLGTQKPDGGAYTLTVSATDASGAAIKSRTYQRGLASSIQQAGTDTTVNVNGVNIPVSAVTAVS